MSQKILAQGAEATIYLTKPKTKTPHPKKISSINKKTAKKSACDFEAHTNCEQSEPIIAKHRIKKSYRIPELDKKIQTRRTRAETKIMQKASKIIPIPKIIKSDEKSKEIIMQFINGKKLSDHLDNFSLTKQKQILKQIGESVAKLHKENIIHGDLTTSNMIYVENLPAHSHSQIGGSVPGQVQGTSLKKSVNQNNQLIFSLTNSQRRNPPAISEPTIFFIDFGLAFQNAKYEDKAVDIHLLKQALEAKHFKHWEKLYKEFEKTYKSLNKKEAEKVLNQLNKVEKRGRYRH